MRCLTPKGDKGPGVLSARRFHQAFRRSARVLFSHVRAVLSLLADKGHELRRPHAENIGDGLYELQVKFYCENLRMLYFFHGRTIAVVSHGFSKERKIPPGEIEAA